MQMALNNSPSRATDRRVRFSSVTTHTFRVGLDGSKLPSSGCSPIGLGEAYGEAQPEPVDSYEGRRVALRRPVEQLLLGHGARLQLLEGVDPVELRALEAENEAILRAVEGPEIEMAVDRQSSPEPPASDGGAGAATIAAAYTTAHPEDTRAGAGRGFEERQGEEEERRKRRHADEKAATEVRKAERRRCAGCKRFACIC